ncbi:hypothetical protein KR018_006082 [Drosophila ironensis]|nr:hypothetical protein KR018_006082 [Drosophila ironensis]
MARSGSQTAAMLLLVGVAVAISAIVGVTASSIPGESGDTKHFDGDLHNTKFDHDAFLGPQESKTFDSLPPEESIRRLGIIYDRIDENKDKLVTMAELKNWLDYTQRKYIEEDTARMWKQHNPENNATISWEKYRDHLYGFVDHLSPEEADHGKSDNTYGRLLKRDRRRWSHADFDLDDHLNREEFQAFLHPEDHPKMKHVITVETVEDIDTDKDGKISVDEYLGDLYSPGTADEEEPEWVANEREAFSKYRDLNNDGYMDMEELGLWLGPDERDHSEAEAKHLIYEADTDHDQKLSKEEVLAKYDVFVGSQATDFGEYLTRHDEF